MHPSLSPDARWLAYTSWESGAPEVYVRPFPETATAKWQVSTAGGTEATWAKDGRELFYIDSKGDLVAMEIGATEGFSMGEHRVLFSTGAYSSGTGIQAYDVHPDGRRFIFLGELSFGNEGELIVATNWLQTLKSRAKK